MDTTAANAKAQTAFRAALEARERTGHWTEPEVDEYLNAEQNVRWEVAKAEMDALLAADHEYHLFTGLVHPGCEECKPENGDWRLYR
jgi:hypothetical protein